MSSHPKSKNEKGIRWAYFAPDGYLQVRSIAETRKLARENIANPFGEHTYLDYEAKGFYLSKIDVDIKFIEKAK